MSARCKSCGAPIVWAKTAKGASMPVDAEPSEDGNVVLVETEREVRAIVVKQDDAMVRGPRHRSHFSTCPQAAQHRKA